VTQRTLRESGFTLVEMAMVLLVLGLLTRAAIVPLGSLLEHRHRADASAQLQEIKQAVFAHVIAYGALPCPVAPARPITEYPSENVVRQDTQNLTLFTESCRHSVGGVPATALGLSGVLSDSDALVDPWGREYVYAASLTSHPTARVGVSRLTASIALCKRTYATGCPDSAVRADQLAFLILSLGSNPARMGSQGENQDGDEYFVLQPESHEPDAPFDDQLVWGTAADVMYWMLKMGWLP
jgi:prepilin-type N-terminal cleavage/methylation domain-containing protein